MKPVLCGWLVLLASAGLAPAQRANFPWWNSPVTSEIISPSEAHRIRQIVRSYRDRLFDARNAQQKAEADLEDLLNGPDVNIEAAKPLIERLASARANTSRVFLEMSVQVRGVLTLDEWRMVVKRWDEMQRKKPSDTQSPP